MIRTTTTQQGKSPGETVVPIAILSPTQASRLPLQRRGAAGFTLAELLVTLGVLVVLVLLFAQLLKSAATVTTLGHKQMDADSQARELLDRMAIDVAQMVKRPDVDYYLKSSQTAQPDCTTCVAQTGGNDRIAFFSTAGGYYSSPAPTPSSSSKSPISLVAYRVNANTASSSYNQLERMGKGLAWNGVNSIYVPIRFLDSPTTPTTTISNTWATGVSSTAADSDYEIIGPQIFRFEYYYLLKNGSFSGTPWTGGSGHTTVAAMQDVAAIVADIAVIDPKSKVLLTNAQLATLTTSGNANYLSDYTSGMTPGQLRTQWQNTVNAITGLPRPALSGIRFYERFLYLSPPNLGTP